MENNQRGKKLNLPVNFMKNVADVEIAFQNANKMTVGGIEFDVEFEVLANKQTGKNMVAARARIDEFAVAASPWQDTEDPYLSAVFALRHALENSGRSFFKPQAGDIARLTYSGVVKDGIISSLDDLEKGYIEVCHSNTLPYLDGSRLIVEKNELCDIPTYRLRKTGFFETLKVWKYKYSSTPGSEVNYLISRPIWMVV